MATSLEAKICVLGAQGVGKTSLLHRYVKGTFHPPDIASTIGASFLVKKVLDVDSGTTVRLQLWDTAGQERFRAISRLYYRGASAILLVYSLLDEASFDEMGRWLLEIKRNVDEGVIIHVVGTKTDIVAQDPSKRKVAFEKCIAFVAENLFPEQFTSPTAATSTTPAVGSATSGSDSGFRSLDGMSKRSSGFWGQDVGWDCCHEISSSSGEGIEEVFRVITRKLVEQHQKKLDSARAAESGMNGAGGKDIVGATKRPGPNGQGSFRVGYGDRRRSWLGLPTSAMVGISDESTEHGDTMHTKGPRKGCC